MMEFVVKATGPGGDSAWLSKPRLEGFRGLVAREVADVFQTRRDAQVAIAKMPAAFARAGVIFAIELAD